MTRAAGFKISLPVRCHNALFWPLAEQLRVDIVAALVVRLVDFNRNTVRVAALSIS